MVAQSFGRLLATERPKVFTLKIQTTGAAFSTYDDAVTMAEQYHPSPEIARILRNVADRIENGDTVGFCIDANGNNVGSFRLDQ